MVLRVRSLDAPLLRQQFQRLAYVSLRHLETNRHLGDVEYGGFRAPAIRKTIIEDLTSQLLCLCFRGRLKQKPFEKMNHRQPRAFPELRTGRLASDRVLRRFKCRE